MKRTIHLYINGSEADLSDDGLVLFNYTRDEASNPSIIKNSYSQEVSLPPTDANTAIVGHYNRVDRVTPIGGFNALKKASFEIRNDKGEILESGYAKLTAIEADGTIKMTLYGGLGEFFYNLSYKADGTKKKLSDLLVYNGSSYVAMSTINYPLTKANVKTAWDALRYGTTTNYANFLNFAPALNGLPSCKFKADKAVYKEGAAVAQKYKGIYTTSGNYSPKTGADGHILLQMKNKHTEWEVQDLRAYLQRPVVNVWEMCKVIAYSQNTGDYTLTLGSDFFTVSNLWLANLWLTMPMFDRDNISPTSAKMSDLITLDITPADFLIGLAKTFGLVFVYDKVSKTVTIDTRFAYYQNTVEDISDLVENKRELTPVLAEAKNYIFQPAKVFGKFAEEYEDKYGKTYGSQWANTGFDFDAEPIEVLENYPFNGAPDALESSAYYQVFGGETSPSDIQHYLNYYFKFAMMEDTSWKLYYTDGNGDESSQECEMTITPYIHPFHYDKETNNNFRHFITMPQFHKADNKADGGDGVLLFFNGTMETPTDYSHNNTIKFHLSDDSNAMLLLTEGEPCWDVSIYSSNVVDVTGIPYFRRSRLYSGSIYQCLEFGQPQEVATTDVPGASTMLYYTRWKSYLEDKFNLDTKGVKVKVNLNGRKVDESLFRKFYFFDGSLWVLNKISNHSLTTYDLTECEFIQVQDKNHYLNGQTI